MAERGAAGATRDAEAPAPDTRERLVSILARVAGVADRVRPVVRRITLVAALSGLWLAYAIHDLSGAPPGVTLAILLVLWIPAAVLGWVWWLLVELAELPEHAGNIYGSLGNLAGKRAAPAGSGGVGELFRVGGQLREAFSLAVGAEGLSSAILGVLVFANPLFLLVLGACLLWAGALAVIAALTAVLALLF